MPSEGYIATTKHTSTTGTGPFAGPAVDYIDSSTDIEVEKIADGAEPNAGVILTKVASSPGATEYTLDSSASPPTVTLGAAAPLISGDVLKVRRKTTRGSREVAFVQGSTLTEADLDKATKQGIYLGEEAIDKAKDANDLYDDMASSYTAGVMPSYGSDGNIMVSNGSTWAVLGSDTSAARTYLGLGTSATVNTGTTATSTVPLNTSSAALGTAAYKAHGTASGAVPLNSDLGTSSTVATGTTTGTIPVLIATNALPAVSGVNLTNVKQSPRVTIQHAYTMVGGGNSDAGSSYALTGNHLANTWHIRPLTTIITHYINGAVADIGVTVTGPNNAAIATGGVGSEIRFESVGTYHIEMHSCFLRGDECTTRLLDLHGTTSSNGAAAVAIQGSTCSAETAVGSAYSVGSGVILIGATDSTNTQERCLIDADGPDARRFQLEFAMSANVNFDTYNDGLGPAMVATVDGGYITNVFAWIDIVQLST